METLTPLALAPLIFVDRAYLLVWGRNPSPARGVFQRVQLARLGIDVKFVVGCDQEELSLRQRNCIFGEGAKLSGMYASQLVKLWAALYDMVSDGLRRALFLEDDVVVHFDRLPVANLAFASVPRLRLLHLSSYHPIGYDLAVCGVRPKTSPNVGRRPLMAGVANALTRSAALQMLTSIPIVASGTDDAFSNDSLSSTPHDAWYVKPYPFTAGAYGKSELFSCYFDTGCERRFYRSWRGHANHSSWISQLLERERPQYAADSWGKTVKKRHRFRHGPFMASLLGGCADENNASRMWLSVDNISLPLSKTDWMREDVVRRARFSHWRLPVLTRTAQPGRGRGGRWVDFNVSTTLPVPVPVTVFKAKRPALGQSPAARGARHQHPPRRRAPD